MNEPNSRSDVESAFLLKPADIIAIIQMQRGVIALFTVTVFLVTLIGSMLATRQYRATATLHISPIAGQEVRVDQVVENDQVALWDPDKFYRTQLEILQSRRVRENAIARYEQLGYDDLTAKGGGVARLSSMIQVVPREESELFDVHVTFTDPDHAAVLSNLVAEVYQAENLRSRQTQSADARRWLGEQLEVADGRIKEARRKLLAYKGSHSIEDADAATTEEGSQLSSLHEALGRVATERVLLESTIRVHQKLLASEDYQELAKDMNTPLIARLAEDWARASTEHARIAARYGEKYPERVQAEAELARIESELRAEVERTLEAEKAKLALLRQNEESLGSELQLVKDQLLAREAIEGDYESLVLEAELAREDFKALAQRASQLDLAAQTQLNNVTIIDRALPDSSPVKPNVLMNVIISIVTGLVGGVAIAFFREYVDDTISSPLDVQTYLRVPFLGMVPRVEGAKDEQELALWTHQNPTSSVAESMRALRTVLELTPSGKSLKRILVTSSVSAEGKTSTTVRLAIAFANLNRRVVMIDADLRRPRLHKIFGLSRDAGLSTVLSGMPITQATQPTGVPNLDVITAGLSTDRPNELLASVEMPPMLDALDDIYDLVIIDSPPSVMLSDAIILSKYVDGVVIVVREQQASRHLVRETIQRITQVGSTVLGVVVNAVDMSGPRTRYKYYYGYRYYYGYDGYYGSRDAVDKVDKDAVDKGKAAK